VAGKEGAAGQGTVDPLRVLLTPVQPELLPLGAPLAHPMGLADLLQNSLHTPWLRPHHQVKPGRRIGSSTGHPHPSSRRAGPPQGLDPGPPPSHHHPQGPVPVGPVEGHPEPLEGRQGLGMGMAVPVGPAR